MVRMARFELAVSRTRTEHFTKLSYILLPTLLYLKRIILPSFCLFFPKRPHIDPHDQQSDKIMVYISIYNDQQQSKADGNDTWILIT